MERSPEAIGTVLVTGGSGFLGSWCVVELLRRGHRVRTTVRSLSREPEVRAIVASELDADDRLSVLAADLRGDDGWERAVDGCDHVLHVASPFPSAQPKDPDELIVPAREGTLRVLGAALEAGVGRVVVTSSVAAIRSGGGLASAPLTERDWTDPADPKLTPYTRSKTIAERSAWELVRERDEVEKLAVVNPGAILGPVLGGGRSYSLEVVERLLKGMPGVPRIGWSFVDVRDVADLQISAMTAPEAGGERFIAAGPFMWMSQVAEVLRDGLGEPAVTASRRLSIREPRVCLVDVGRLLIDAGTVTERGLIDGVAAPSSARLMLARADRENGAGRVSGADDDVLGLGGAVDEVPLAQGPLLALDDQQRRAGQHEKVLLVGLPVIHPHRLTRREHEEADSNLRELRLALEGQASPPPLAVLPACLACVEDEPPLLGGREPTVGDFEPRLGDHHGVGSVSAAVCQGRGPTSPAGVGRLASLTVAQLARSASAPERPGEGGRYDG